METSRKCRKDTIIKEVDIRLEWLLQLGQLFVEPDLQAAQQGAAPHILLCGPAGDIALKDAPASATAPQPPRDMSGGFAV